MDGRDTPHTAQLCACRKAVCGHVWMRSQRILRVRGAILRRRMRPQALIPRLILPLHTRWGCDVSSLAPVSMQNLLRNTPHDPTRLDEHTLRMCMCTRSPGHGTNSALLPPFETSTAPSRLPAVSPLDADRRRSPCERSAAQATTAPSPWAACAGDQGDPCSNAAADAVRRAGERLP